MTAATAILQNKRNAVYGGLHAQLRVTAKKFGEAVEEFLEWKHVQPLTKNGLRSSLASASAFFGAHVPVHSITAHRVEQYKTHRRQEHKVKEITLRHNIHALTGFFKYAVRAGWCSQDPMMGIEVPSAKDAQREHVVTPAEEAAYFAIAPKTLHDIARIVLDQGMRPGEVFCLRVQDVDFDQGLIRVPGGKTKAAKRSLLMSAAVREILTTRAAGRATGWLFPSYGPTGHIMTVVEAHERVIAKIGASFVLYEFRHTFATRFGEATGDAIALSKILGHSNLQTAMKYCHPQESHLVRAMRDYQTGDQSGTK